MGQSFNPPEVWQPFGAFAMGHVQGEGKVVHLKGQVALDRDGRIVGKGDMAAQTLKVLENIQSVLASVGGTMADIFQLAHYTTDIEAFMAVGAVRKRFFRPPYPVTTTLEVARLYDPDLLIEITASAEVPLNRYQGRGRAVAAARGPGGPAGRRGSPPPAGWWGSPPGR